MRPSWPVLLLVPACAAVPGAPASPPPGPPVVTAVPSLPPATATASAPAPAASAPVASAASTATCALMQIDLPANLPPCSPPGSKEYETEADLDVDLAPFPATVKPGASVELTVTMKNVSHVPLRIMLSPSQTPTFEVYDAKGQAIEPPVAAPTPVPPECARVDCAFPLRPSPPSPPAAYVTLAPGGIARAHATWRARRWVLSPARVTHCCSDVVSAPVDAGPLGPGSYQVNVRPPLGPYDGSPGVSRGRADIDVAP